MLDAGEHRAPVDRLVEVGDVSSLALVSDHKVTTCSAVGGSRDSSTLGRNLCDGRVSRAGSLVRLVVAVAQRTRTGRACGPRQVVVDRTVRVPADVHHLTLASKGRVRVRRAAGCLPRFRVRGLVALLRGADLVVHAPSERTAVLPG